MLTNKPHVNLNLGMTILARDKDVLKRSYKFLCLIGLFANLVAPEKGLNYAHNLIGWYRNLVSLDSILKIFEISLVDSGTNALCRLYLSSTFLNGEVHF